MIIRLDLIWRITHQLGGYKVLHHFFKNLSTLRERAIDQCFTITNEDVKDTRLHMNGIRRISNTMFPAYSSQHSLKRHRFSILYCDDFSVDNDIVICCSGKQLYHVRKR